jgi:hypothetical protein
MCTVKKSLKILIYSSGFDFEIIFTYGLLSRSIPFINARKQVIDINVFT